MGKGRESVIGTESPERAFVHFRHDGPEFWMIIEGKFKFSETLERAAKTRNTGTAFFIKSTPVEAERIAIGERLLFGNSPFGEGIAYVSAGVFIQSGGFISGDAVIFDSGEAM